MLYFKLTLCAILLLFHNPIRSQIFGATVYNTTSYIAGNISDQSPSVYFGPQSNLFVSGSLTLHAEQVWIHPQAVFQGPGKLIISSLNYLPYYTTLIDHNNGIPFGVDIVIRNPFGIRLTDLLDPGFNTPHTSYPLAARLNTNANIIFEPNSGPIYLHNSDLALLQNDSELINTGGNRYVISGNTNLGHLIKRNASFGSFTFPLGISTNSYTPATLEFSGLAAANVVNYQASGLQIQAPSEGIDRTWHIYGELDSSGKLSLQHQQATQGALYDDQSAFITQYLGQQIWSSANSIHFIQNQYHQYAHFEFPSEPNTPSSWFSKTSDFQTPLPVTLTRYQVNCVASRTELFWRTESEFNSHYFRIEGSHDLIDWVNLGEVASQGSEIHQQDYRYRLPYQRFDYLRLNQVDYDGTETHYASLHNHCSSHSPQDCYIYPNPSTGLATLFVQSQEDVEMEMILYDQVGKIIDKRDYQFFLGQNETLLDLRGISAGLYTLLLIDTKKKKNEYILKLSLK